MRTSDSAAKMIMKHESLRLSPYLCPAGVPTIGYGNTYYEDGSMVKLTDERITEARAETLFKNILKQFETGVSRLVKVKLKQNQFDALVSFCYNVGLGNFQTSTLLKKINNNPSDPDIRHEFMRWNKSRGKVLNGLIKRREEEANLYFL